MTVKDVTSWKKSTDGLSNVNELEEENLREIVITDDWSDA